MTKHQTGAKNGMWKGGRSIASNGYVLLRVGVDHHLADVRGYAYEHRVVAEQMLGRRLRRGEQVHHRDHDKTNNAPENLEVLSTAAHGAEHVDEFTNDVRDVLGYFPCTRPQLAELMNTHGRRVGWALSRLRKKGQVRSHCGSWHAVPELMSAPRPGQGVELLGEVVQQFPGGALPREDVHAGGRGG